MEKFGVKATLYTLEILDFPGETFRVLKEKEEKEYGEYRPLCRVLEAWDKLELGI